jgi:GT2 family glycosyltransferase
VNDPEALPPVSIVISTLDRAAYLRRLLAALEQLDYPAFEVVVVNGPSTDETDAVLAAHTGRIKVLRCPVRNLSRSRNIGVSHAAGEVVAFIDDDALPASPDWLRGLAAALAHAPDAGGVGGPVLIGDGDAWEFEGRVISDYGLMATPLDAARAGILVDGRRWVRGVQGNNCAFRRALLLVLGGFDEAFTYHFDESDVCVRASRAGHPVTLAPGSAVRHYRATSHNRRAAYDLDWAGIARADTYFALKNAADPLPRRLLRSLWLARRKYPFFQINQLYRQGRFGPATRLRFLGRWARGVLGGTWMGLARPRRTPLRPDILPPAPFLPFAQP